MKDDEILHDENLQSDLIPPAIQERYEAIRDLRKKIVELAESRVENPLDPSDATDEQADFPVFDPVARQLIDAYCAEEDSGDKRLVSAMDLPRCPSDLVFEMQDYMREYPTLFRDDAFERFWKAMAVSEFFADFPASDWRTDYAPRFRPLRPLRRELFFGLVKRRLWDPAYSVYFEWQLHKEGDDPELDGLLWDDRVTHEHIAKLSEATREELILAFFRNTASGTEDECECLALHPLETELGRLSDGHTYSSTGRQIMRPFFKRKT